jgi:hypothetical protein
MSLMPAVKTSAKNARFGPKKKKKRKLNNAPRNKKDFTKRARTNRRKARTIQGLSPHDYFYEAVRKAVKKCGKDTIDFLRVRDTEVDIRNGLLNNPFASQHNSNNNNLSNVINHESNTNKDKDTDTIGGNRNIGLLQKRTNQVDKDTVTLEELNHVGIVLLTTRRKNFIEKLKKVLLGEQVHNSNIMFGPNFLWEIFALYDLFHHNFMHANDLAYKFDLLFAFTYIISQYNYWMNDYERNGKGNNFLPSLSMKWRNILSNRSKTLGIHAKDPYTHSGMLAFLESFKLKLTNSSINIGSLFKTRSYKKKERKFTLSHGKEVVSYEGYDDYIPWTETEANILKYYKEQNNSSLIESMTGRIHSPDVNMAKRRAGTATNIPGNKEADPLREEIKKVLIPAFTKLKTSLPATHPRILRMNILLEQFGLMDHLPDVLLREKLAIEESVKFRQKLPSAKQMLYRRIKLVDDNGEWFNGSVISVKKGNSKKGVKDATLVRVLYDDGETDTDLDLATEQFEWLESTPESSEIDEESQDVGGSEDEEESEEENSTYEQASGSNIKPLIDEREHHIGDKINCIYEETGSEVDSDSEEDDTALHPLNLNYHVQTELAKVFRDAKVGRATGDLEMKRKWKKNGKLRYVRVEDFTHQQLGSWLYLLNLPSPGSKSKRLGFLMPYLVEQKKWRKLRRLFKLFVMGQKQKQ